jgi:hypothetical protein
LLVLKLILWGNPNPEVFFGYSKSV